MLNSLKIVIMWKLNLTDFINLSALCVNISELTRNPAENNLSQTLKHAPPTRLKPVIKSKPLKIMHILWKIFTYVESQRTEISNSYEA